MVRETPTWLANVMNRMSGSDPKFIMEREKGLTKTDVCKVQGRLNMPWSMIENTDFLNHEELQIIDDHYNEVRDKGLDVMLVDLKGKEWELNLRRWDMKTSSNYVLVSGWSKVVKANKLKKGHKIQIWSFRTQEKLYFALVPPAFADIPAPAPAPDHAAPSRARARARVLTKKLRVALQFSYNVPRKRRTRRVEVSPPSSPPRYCSWGCW